MTQYFYRAKNGPNKIVQGSVEAEDKDRAVQQVIDLGYFPTDVSPVEDGKGAAGAPVAARLPFFRKISSKDISGFTRQMSDLIEAAVPVLQSLSIVASQTRNPYFCDIIEDIFNKVRDGSSLSNALSEYPEIFSPLYVNLVKTGEVGGRLEVVLARLANYLEKENETQFKIQSSLAYPMLILIIGILTVFVLLTFVVPRLTVIFEDLGQELPLPTVILMSLSDFFAAYWWAVIIGIGGFGYYFRRWLQTESGREWFDNLMLHTPVLGKFLKTVEVGRFSLTLGTLVETGVVITTALDSVWLTVQNVIMRNEIRKVYENVANGMSLRKALEHSAFFPELAVNMISVGEETGQLDKSLYKIADVYEREANEQVKMLLSLLGPLVLIVVVAFVGFIVIALLLPVFQINLLVQ